MNQHLFYKSFLEMKEEYRDLLLEIEENEGEITEEIKERFLTLDENFEESLFSIYNIIKETSGSIENRDKEIDRLERKNAIASKSIEQWRKFIIELVKMRADKNKSGNSHVKVGDLSFTVSKSKALQIDDDFSDERYTSWKLKERIPTEHKDRIANFLKTKMELEDVAFEKMVDKLAVKSEIDKGNIVEGARIQESDKLLIK